MTKGATQERRRSGRRTVAKRVGIQLLHQRRSIAANGINISEGGLCLRLEEELQVRSLVRLQFTPERLRTLPAGLHLVCTGRVAWVIQRLDLRPIPPFLFDVGIEFVDPPAAVRQFIARQAGEFAVAKESLPRERVLETATVRGREFVPRLTRITTASLPWHLIVTVDGLPCFSGHYPSERATLKAWAQFKREQMKR
mgnify:CR=1 FL=1